MTRRLRIINRWRTLPRDQWDEFQIGERRAVRFRDPDVTVVVQKTARGRWKIDPRGGLPVEKLADLPTAPVVRKNETAALTPDGVVTAARPLRRPAL